MYCFMLWFLLVTSPFDAVVAENNSSSNVGAFLLFDSMQDLFGNNSLTKLLNNVRDVFSFITSESRSLNYDNQNLPEDAYLGIKELVNKYGYRFEDHKVYTEDGYILTLHRIPHGKQQKVHNNIVVLLMHGLMDSSDSWVLQGPDKALAYVLAESGYDVWMANARGNKYSSEHISLYISMAKFWKFSWEEIGLYDLPATIDYILKYTQQKNLYYVGHSQGTTSFYVMSSMKPEYNDKIKLMFSLSPVAYMGNVKSPIVRMFSPANKVIAYWLSQFDIYSSSIDFFNKLLSVICYVLPKCDNLLYLVVGNNHRFINDSLLPVYFSHLPSGSSTLQFVHYGQLVQSGRFCRFDFGEEVNLQLYKNTTPPEYELHKITSPIVLFYSNNDWLSNPWDVKLLGSKVANLHRAHYIEDFNHLDFMYAYNAKDRIYSKITEHIHKYEYLFTVIREIKTFSTYLLFCLILPAIQLLANKLRIKFIDLIFKGLY